ncbi:MAG: SCO family protein [Sediminibacterium sp.]
MRGLNFIFLVILFPCSCKQSGKNERQLPFYNTSSFTPLFVKEVPDNFHHIPSFRLLDQTGTVFTEKNMDGKICVADFFFTSCPGICPRMSFNMKILQDSFLHDESIQLLSHSVMPATDSVPVLQLYAAKKGVNADRWRLLTGSKQEIYNLGRRFYFVEEDEGEKKDTTQFLHTENFILLDGKRRIRGIYNGLSLPSIQNLIADIKELKKEM